MLSRIKIKKYKKFSGDEFHVFNFKKGLNVIIGENNAGKTTLVKVIKAFFDNDGKLFKELVDANILPEQKPEIEIEWDNQTYKLLTDGKTWKFNTPKTEVFSYGFISANPTISEISESISNAFLNRINNNANLLSLFEDEKREFNQEVSLMTAKTNIISEENDDYSVMGSIDLKKALTISFDLLNPKSIANKGLGQQKEFLINYFIEKNTLRNTDVLIVDEIENSLSIKSVEELVSRIKESHSDKQFFVTTHNVSTVGDGVGINLVSIGLIPPKIVKNVSGLVLCEGPNDQKVLSHFWPDHTFVHGDGSQIINQATNLFNGGKDFKVIVDGDLAGLGYKSALSTISNTIFVHDLKRGTMEDYISENFKNFKIQQLGGTILNPMVDMILQNHGISNTLCPNIKSELKWLLNSANFSDYDSQKLKDELDSFL